MAEKTSIFFNYAAPMIDKAHHEPLTAADLGPLAHRLQCGAIYAGFEERMVRTDGGLLRSAPPAAPSADTDMTTIAIPSSGSAAATTPLATKGPVATSNEPFAHSALKDATAEERRAAVQATGDPVRTYLAQGYTLWNLIFRAVWRDLAQACTIGLVRAAAVMLQIWSLWTMVRIAAGEDGWGLATNANPGGLHRGTVFAVAVCLPIGAFLQSQCQHNVFHISYRAAITSRALATALIFEKVKIMTPLHLGGADSKKKGSKANKAGKDAAKDHPKEEKEKATHASVSGGKLLNHVTSDAGSLVEAQVMIPMSINSMYDNTAAIIWLFVHVGWPTAVLLGMTAVFLYLQLFSGGQVSKNKGLVAQVADQRLRSLTEFISGIQVVKFYAWEANVRAMIGVLRAAEARLHVIGNIYKLMSLTTIFFVPSLMYLAVFGIRIRTESGTLRPADTFLTIALIGVIGRTFQILPRALSSVGTAKASVGRIEAFLRMDVTSALPSGTTGPQGGDALVLEGDFGWSDFAVRSARLRCAPATLTVILGPVGSGKSTLLQATLGDCAALSPSYTRHLPGNGRVAYVPQEAFVYDTTVRGNITFGLPYDEERYRRVLKACALVRDLAQWGGDLVEVGDRGVTLSGGQRQRLSLARACYADADVYILDDPISAVDASVGRHLLRRCIRGFLADKIVLLATHHPAPARYAHSVIVLDNGLMRARVSGAAFASVVGTKPLNPLRGDADADDDAASTASEITEVISRIGAESTAGDELWASDDEADESSPQDDADDEALRGLLGKARILRVQEVDSIGSVSGDVYRAYLSGGGACMAAVTIGLFLFCQLLRTGTDWWFAAWTGRLFADTLSPEEHMYVLAALVFVMIVFGFVRTIAFGVFTIRASSFLHNHMFEAVIASPMHFFEGVPLGRIMNRFAKDLDYCDDLLPRTIFDFMQLVLVVIGNLAMLIYSVPWFAIAVVVELVIFGYVVYRFLPASRYMRRIEGSLRSPSVQAFQTTLTGLATIRAFGRLGDFQQMFLQASDDTSNAIMHSDSMQRWAGVRLDSVAISWVASAALLCAGLIDQLEPSLIGLCLSQTVFLTGMLQFAVRMGAETENLMTAVERLHEYGQLPPEDNEGKIGAADLPPQWPQDADICVKNLTVAHHSNPTAAVLKKLTFTIRAGQRVAVVGRTGAGKSTLLSAFYRLLAVPDGAITIGGVPTTDVDIAVLRARLGIIPQVPTIFHGNIRRNLDPFGEHTDAAMLAVLDKVRLLDYVTARGGLDTPVGEGGGTLSVGQKQLLCAARVLLRESPILFMDEATANIDEATDAQIQEILREEARRRRVTIVTIAHRLNTIMDYDLVLVLADGRLVEVGNPRALVAADGASEDAASEDTATSTNVNSADNKDHDTQPSTADFVLDVQSLDEHGLFARMVRTMNEAAAEGQR